MGTALIPGGAPVFGTSFLDGPVAVGQSSANPSFPPTAWFFAPGSGWSAQEIDTTSRWPQAAFELNDSALLGDRRLVVGYTLRDPQATGPEGSFAAVEKQGGGWSITDLQDRVPAGTSLELRALGATGDPRDSNTFFVAAGAVKSGAPNGQYLSNDITGATPISMVSVNGTDWNSPVQLPLPDGVSAAEGTAVAYCGPNTPAPGVLVSGVGYAADPILGTRLVGIVWLSSDGGTTWNVISDNSFNQQGRNMYAHFVAADASHVVVGGQVDMTAASSAGGGKPQQESAVWILGSGNTWSLGEGGQGLQATQSSVMTALAARQAGGFLAADEVFDTSSGPTDPGASTLTGHPSAQIVFAPDGLAWADISSSLPGIDQASLVDGIAETANTDVFIGMDMSAAGASWTVDRSSIK